MDAYEVRLYNEDENRFFGGKNLKGKNNATVSFTHIYIAWEIWQANG